MDSERKTSPTSLGAVIAFFGACNIFLNIGGPELGLACIGAGFVLMASGALRGLKSKAD